MSDAPSIQLLTSVEHTQVRLALSKDDVAKFIQFPFHLYHGDPNWTPPFVAERQAFFDPNKNPFFEHAQYQLFLVEQHGKLVGTIAGIVDDRYNELHHEQIGYFGFFECIDDPDVALVLLAAAEDWVRKQGMKSLRGPMNFSPNQEWGLLVEGFSEPAFIMMTYNPPYYAKLIEQHGYHKAMDMYAYIANLEEGLQNAPTKLFRTAQKAASLDGITVRKAQMRDFHREIQIIRAITNEALANMWGFVPFTDREATHLAASLRQIADPDLVLIAETSDGKPIGISLAIPDLHQALKWAGGGRMFPFGLIKFLWYRRKITQVRLVMIGVIEEYRGRGIDAIFYVETARMALSKGYKRLEGSWVLESNLMMNRIINRLGGQKYKTYRIYEKSLDTTAQI